MSEPTWSQEIDAWSVATFGTPTLLRAVHRAAEEFRELEHAAGESRPDWREHTAEECADVVICLTRVCSLLGFDLATEIEKKMAKNYARRWRCTGDGTGYHE